MDYFSEYEKLTNDLQISDDFSYNFAVGDILLEIDRSQSEINTADNSRVFGEYNQFADNSRVFGEYNQFADNSRREIGNYGGVTVNFNAYNEIIPSGGEANIDAVIEAFGEKLADMIVSAAEGARL